MHWAKVLSRFGSARRCSWFMVRSASSELWMHSTSEVLQTKLLRIGDQWKEGLARLKHSGFGQNMLTPPPPDRRRACAGTVDCVWNVMTHAQKPDFVFRRNAWVHFNPQVRQFSRLLAAEVCASAVVILVMLDTPCSEVVWRVLATNSIRQFPLHFPSLASPCAITFQLDSTHAVKVNCILSSKAQYHPLRQNNEDET
jgi:hypothetical protein